tara:strand:+ start:236 stop:451 length:216 start_codon:yes stop_codon:yes gene_type:complete
MKDKLHKPHSSFKSEQKIFDGWRQFLNESAAPPGAQSTANSQVNPPRYDESLEHQIENHIYEYGILEELLK